MIVADAFFQGQPGEAEGKQDARPTDVGRPFKETNSVRASMWSGSRGYEPGFENGHMLAGQMSDGHMLYRHNKTDKSLYYEIYAYKISPFHLCVIL